MLVTNKTFDECLSWFDGRSRLIVDTETTGLHPWLGDRVCGVSLTLPSLAHRCYFPIRHRPGGNLSWSRYRQLLSRLSQPGVVLTGWNIKFDLEMLRMDGLRIPYRVEDVMLACHHLNENDKPFELKRWAAKYVDPHADEAEAELTEKLRALCKELKLPVKKGHEKQYISYLHPRDAQRYACDDVRYSEKLRRLALPALCRWDTLDLWRESNRYLLAVMGMEIRGMQLDVPLIHRYIAEAKRKERNAYRKLVAVVGHDININSPKQVCAFLNISSSRKEILDELGTPECEQILSCRAWNKVRTTYYEKWLGWKDADDVLHPNLNLHRVVTGRQSASDPNTHAVPRYRPEYKVKDVVIAREGYTLISADYNQAELRMGVSVAREENMAKLFLSSRKVDIHQSVADALGLKGKEGRDTAKTINFMILYGGGEEKLAKKLRIPLLDAREYLRKYHTEYWHFRHTSKFWANRARYQGYIRLWTGRIRHFNHPLANPKDAFNSLVQGGVAEMLRIAILRLRKQLRPYDTHMLLQIHDQIIFECPHGNVAGVVPIIKQAMEDFPQFLIPPIVDVKLGQRWGDLHDYEEGLRAA